MDRCLPTKKEICDTLKRKHNLTDKCDFKYESFVGLVECKRA